MSTRLVNPHLGPAVLSRTVGFFHARDMGKPNVADDKKPATDQERIAKLEQQNRDLWFQVGQMQKMGGFADAKTLGIRCTRIEGRIDLVELDGEMLKDVSAFHHGFVEQHLKDRHDVGGIDRDDAPDVVPWRRARQTLRRWAEKRGLMTKRRDVAGARQDENRLRPVREQA